MSDNVPHGPGETAETDSLKQALTEKTILVQKVREELIRAQITVLELQDTVLQKETDKADAVAILGQAELVLEGKINYIFELDRVLNERIRALEKQLSEAHAAHETVTSDLVQKLDQTNRALGDAHQLAAGYARESAESREALAKSASAVEQLRFELRDSQSRSEAQTEAMSVIRTELSTTALAKSALEQQLAAIHGSFAWKITAPFRSSSERRR